MVVLQGKASRRAQPAVGILSQQNNNLQPKAENDSNKYSDSPLGRCNPVFYQTTRVDKTEF